MNRQIIARHIPYTVVLQDDICLSSGFAELFEPDSPHALESLTASDVAVMAQPSHANRTYRPLKTSTGSADSL